MNTKLVFRIMLSDPERSFSIIASAEETKGASMSLEQDNLFLDMPRLHVREWFRVAGKLHATRKKVAVFNLASLLGCFDMDIEMRNNRLQVLLMTEDKKAHRKLKQFMESGA